MARALARALSGLSLASHSALSTLIMAAMSPRPSTMSGWARSKGTQRNSAQSITSIAMVWAKAWRLIVGFPGTRSAAS